MSDIDLTPLDLSSDNMQYHLLEPTIVVPTVVVPKASNDKKRKQVHCAHSHIAARNKVKRCVHCRKVMMKKVHSETGWETGVCRTCLRLKQAKILLEAAIQYQHTTPKVLKPHVRFEEPVTYV